MALGELVHIGGARRHPLTTETVVGRGSSAELRLSEGFVSSLHAALTWADGAWSVRDLGSHNGTGVNGEPLAARDRRRLKEGDKIAFGQATETWVLADASGPVPFAMADGHAPVLGANGLLALPDGDDPAVTVYFGSNGQWRVDDGGDGRGIADRGVVTIEGTTWTVRLPDSLTSTQVLSGEPEELTLGKVTLEIAADADGRGGSVIVQPDDGESFSFPIGTNLAVLETLARARIADRSGWIARVQLLEELAMTGNRLNVTVFRLRRQFTEAGFVDGAQIVDRGHRRLRLGTARVRMSERSAETLP